MVAKYIKELLFEHECVILPGFGGFLTQYVSADIHPITHKMQPPSRRVAFNEHLKNNDGLLVDAVAMGEILPKAEVLKEIEAFVNEMRDKLLRSRIYELKHVGRFFYNKEDQLEFEPDTTVNYLADSFSLPELFFKPIERNTISMNTVQKSGRPTNARKPSPKDLAGDTDTPAKKTSAAVIILPILLLLLGGASAFLYFNQDNQSLASFNPFVIFGNHEEVKKAEPAVPQASDSTLAENSVDESAMGNEISSKASRYHIVAGSFRSRDNAEKLQRKLEKKNQTSTIIEPQGGEFYRVSIAETDNKDEAKSQLKKLKGSFGKKIWILSI
jgi:flagellar basal body-associated protein FliL